jgi:hypothetical protein
LEVSYRHDAANTIKNKIKIDKPKYSASHVAVAATDPESSRFRKPM